MDFPCGIPDQNWGMQHTGIQRIKEALRINSNVDWEEHWGVGGGEADPVAQEVGEEDLGREDRAMASLHGTEWCLLLQPAPQMLLALGEGDICPGDKKLTLPLSPMNLARPEGVCQLAK